MADKEIKETKEIKEPITDQVDVKKQAVQPEASAAQQSLRHPLTSAYFWLIIVGAIVVAFIIAGVVVAAVRHHEDQQQQTNQSSYGWSSFGGGFSGRTRGSYWSTSSSQDGPTTTTTVTNYTYTSGVVTKIASGSLTVAGNGKAETIKTNSSTQYVGDTKPAVNDSVTVVGIADSKGNITATQIRVDNQ